MQQHCESDIFAKSTMNIWNSLPATVNFASLASYKQSLKSVDQNDQNLKCAYLVDPVGHKGGNIFWAIVMGLLVLFMDDGPTRLLKADDRGHSTKQQTLSDRQTYRIPIQYCVIQCRAIKKTVQ